MIEFEFGKIESLCNDFGVALNDDIKNKLNIYVGKRIFQIKGDCRFNALKYVNIFYRYMQIKKGDNNGKFLGL